MVIDKPGKGMFYATPLHELLQQAGITHLVFTGVTTEVCVQTTMREANDRGYDCLLVEDGTESYFPAFKAAGAGDDRRAGRHRRLDRRQRGAAAQRWPDKVPAVKTTACPPCRESAASLPRRRGLCAAQAGRGRFQAGAG